MLLSSSMLFLFCLFFFSFIYIYKNISLEDCATIPIKMLQKIYWQNFRSMNDLLQCLSKEMHVKKQFPSFNISTYCSFSFCGVCGLSSNTLKLLIFPICLCFNDSSFLFFVNFMSRVATKSNSAYNMMNGIRAAQSFLHNVAWVHARLCDSQKRVHSTRSRKW